MATNIRWRKRLLLDNAEFTDSGSNAVKLYASTIAGAVGAEIGSLTYEGDGGWWYIDIDIETKDNGYYILQYTTNGADWIPIDKDNDSGEPIMINNEPVMLLSGGTMTSDIVMTDATPASHSVTNVNSITFNDTAGTVGEDGGAAGTIIANGNLIDKTADETITGAWTHSGDCTLSGKNTVTGITNFTSDKLEINDVIATPYFYLTHTYNGALSAGDIDGVLFTCDTKITLIAVYECHSGVVDGAACELKIERLSDGEAIGGGDDVTDAFDLKNDAVDTVHKDEALANAAFAIGDRIGVYVSASEAGADNVHLTIVYRYGD